MNQMQTLRIQYEGISASTKDQISKVEKGLEAKIETLKDQMDSMSKMLVQIIQNTSNQEGDRE